MSDPKIKDPGPWIAQWMRVGLSLFKPNQRPPTPREASRAIKVALARGALSELSDNASAAARVLGIHRRTVVRWAADESVEAIEYLWHNGEMPASMDDTLFPLVRIRWPADADAAFANHVLDWYDETVVPRSIEEETQFIELHNFAAFSRGLPPREVREALSARVEWFKQHCAPHVVAAIVYSPNVPLRTFFAPLINLTPFPVKLATTPAKTMTLVDELASRHGLALPQAEL